MDVSVGFAVSATELWVNIFANAGYDYKGAVAPIDFLASYLMDGDVTDQTGNFDGTNNGVTFVA